MEEEQALLATLVEKHAKQVAVLDERQRLVSEALNQRKELEKEFNQALIQSESVLKKRAAEFNFWKQGDRFKIRGFDQVWFIEKIDVEVNIGDCFGRYYHNRNAQPLYNISDVEVKRTVHARKMTRAGSVQRHVKPKTFSDMDMSRAEKF